MSKNKKPNIVDINMARQSLVEELKAQKWNDERINATSDKSLKEMLAHNRDDEKEHASLLIEWLRRNDTPFDKELSEILFKTKDLPELWD